MAKATDVEVAPPAAPYHEPTVKEQLDAMPKVQIRIPLPADITPEEAARMSKPPHVPVCVNGYTYQIRKGHDVMVPKVVADILREARII